MAERRMFSASVVESDSFLDLKPEAQALYFHLGMYADDDGILDSPRKIMRIIGFDQESIDPLIEAGFLLRFDNGMLVIADWKRNNYLQSDRYHETVQQDIKNQLFYDPKSKRYKKKIASKECIHLVSELETTSIQPVSKAENENSIEEKREKKKRKEENFSPSAISFDAEIPDDYIPQIWETRIPEHYWGRFATEDEYYAYAQNHSEEVEQFIKE